uniref:Uncharacterized protein n=1 Tax=Oryza punctata TaxID=4537 RepID=A0A0E0LXY6_ORYPU
MAVAAAAAASRVQARLAARFAPRRLLSSGGKVLGEEEKAAENIYIKRFMVPSGGGGGKSLNLVIDLDIWCYFFFSLWKMEQEKLEKLARKGPSPGEQGSSTPAADVKAEGGPTAGASTVKNKNYTVIAGAVGVLGASAIAWYLLSKSEKSEEVAN